MKVCCDLLYHHVVVIIQRYDMDAGFVEQNVLKVADIYSKLHPQFRRIAISYDNNHMIDCMLRQNSQRFIVVYYISLETLLTLTSFILSFIYGILYINIQQPTLSLYTTSTRVILSSLFLLDIFLKLRALLSAGSTVSRIFWKPFQGPG